MMHADTMVLASDDATQCLANSAVWVPLYSFVPTVVVLHHAVLSISWACFSAKYFKRDFSELSTICALGRLIEAHPNGGPTVEGGADLRPEWRAWIDHCLRCAFFADSSHPCRQGFTYVWPFYLPRTSLCAIPSMSATSTPWKKSLWLAYFRRLGTDFPRYTQG